MFLSNHRNKVRNYIKYKNNLYIQSEAFSSFQMCGSFTNKQI